MLSPIRCLAALALVTPLVLGSFGCASSDPVEGKGSGSGDGGSSTNDIQDDTPNDEPGICLLHNCQADSHCGACDQGRTTCKLDEGRCVACSADTASGCAEGEYCTSWGNCAPEGLECPTDSHGTPQISCGANSDCLACDPMHQVCDLASGTCVACTTGDTSECATDDVCIDNKCEDKCPSTCNTDNDCGQCGHGQGAAHACHAHKCSECSSTYACPAGFTCSANGTCVTECGDHGTGECQTDADCAGCGQEVGLVCHVPINGGTGTCGPEASGCSDLGNGAVVLPSPYDQVTNLCSNDGDCNGIGVEINVGKMLRDLTGIDGIDDANISYPMNVCADVTISNTSCGVCVPCQVDSDCQDIDIDQVALDAFGPIGSIAAAFLLDQVFGSADHKIYMYCEAVAGSYGACVPCPGFVNDCSIGGGGGGGGGSCSHDICSTGGPLDNSCGSCEDTVCSIDPFCCDTEWDSLCVQQAEDWCGASCGGGGGACNHNECSEGSAMDYGCSSCVTDVCDADPFCCDDSWDDICVEQAEYYCNLDCSGGGGGGTCAHNECDTGAALNQACSSCADTVCSADPYCCNNSWDATCVQQAQDWCGLSCGGGGSCSHDECDSGDALFSGCSSCAATVCGADPYCCDTAWDIVCVQQAQDWCGLSCGVNNGYTCSHDECDTGAALDVGCSSCVDLVCGSDPYCCDTSWDSTCVQQAEDWCGYYCG